VYFENQTSQYIYYVIFSIIF